MDCKSKLDVSKDAIGVAKTNSEQLKLALIFHHLDILQEENWSQLPAYDLIVSNPPYIPPSEKQLMPGQVIQHEPELALLVPEHDPLLFYRQIGRFALQHLNKQGSLFFELNEFFALETKQLLQDMGFGTCTLQMDMQGNNPTEIEGSVSLVPDSEVGRLVFTQINTLCKLFLQE